MAVQLWLTGGEMLPHRCITGDCPGTVLYLTIVYSLDRKLHFGTVHFDL